MKVTHYHQTGATEVPITLPYARFAVTKTGKVFVGDETSKPVRVGNDSVSITQNTIFLNGMTGVPVNHNLAIPGVYSVTYLIIEDAGGTVGEVYFDQFTANSFRVRNTGSYKGALRWTIIK